LALQESHGLGDGHLVTEEPASVEGRLHLEEESFDVVVGIVQQDPDGGDPTRPLLVELSGHDRRLAEAGRSAEQHEADSLRGIELRIDLGAFNQFHRRSR
jgi:hypothetical protein